MTDKVEAKRGDAAWKTQRDAIAQRNADAHRRAQAEQRSRSGALEARLADDAQRERQQLEALNARLDKQRHGR